MAGQGIMAKMFAMSPRAPCDFVIITLKFRFTLIMVTFRADYEYPNFTPKTLIEWFSTLL